LNFLRSSSAARAGLSWTQFLKNGENYRKAFDRFRRAEKIARSSARDVKRAASATTWNRAQNLLKIAATIQMRTRFSQPERVSAVSMLYLWTFVGGKPKTESLAKKKNLGGCLRCGAPTESEPP